jgi:hypothetical protein
MRWRSDKPVDGGVESFVIIRLPRFANAILPPRSRFPPVCHLDTVPSLVCHRFIIYGVISPWTTFPSFSRSLYHYRRHFYHESRVRVTRVLHTLPSRCRATTTVVAMGMVGWAATTPMGMAAACAVPSSRAATWAPPALHDGYGSPA